MNFARDMARVHRQAHKMRNVMSTTSSMAEDLRHVHGQDFLDGEVRTNRIMLPYGISSTTMAGLQMQNIINNNDDNVSVGVFDPNRPAVGGGEICIYSIGGTMIYLRADGSITISTKSKSKIDIAVGGEMKLETDAAGSIEFTAGGDINIKNKADVEVSMTTSGNLLMKTPSNVSMGMTTSGEMSMRTPSQSIVMDTGGDISFSDGKGNSLTLHEIKTKWDTI